MTPAAVLLFCLFGTALALPQFQQFSSPVKPQDPLIQRTFLQDESGQTSSSYATQSGTVDQKQVSLKLTPDGRDYYPVITGLVRYVSPEGIPYEVTYVADETGYHPVGTPIPVAPAAQPATFL